MGGREGGKEEERKGGRRKGKGKRRRREEGREEGRKGGREEGRNRGRKGGREEGREGGKGGSQEGSGREEETLEREGQKEEGRGREEGRKRKGSKREGCKLEGREREGGSPALWSIMVDVVCQEHHCLQELSHEERPMRVMHLWTVRSWVCDGVSLQERETVVMEFAVLQQSPELREESNTASEQSQGLVHVLLFPGQVILLK